MTARRLSLMTVATLLGLGASGCRDSDPTALELNGPPAAVARVSGNSQVGTTGAALPQPLVIAVTDAEGNPVPAQAVGWSANGGTISASLDSTENDGRSSISWTLPTEPGVYEATATVSGFAAVRFSAQATPGVGLLVFRYVDAGSYHGCGIAIDEQLYCWGYNGDGQLGIAAGEAKAYPNLVPDIQRFRSVSGGRYHTCGVTLSGGIICWGQNRDSRAITGDPVSYQAVQAGLLHTCGLNMSREIFCWGYTGEGQVGIGIAIPGRVVDTVAFVGNTYKTVTAGGLHNCGIKEDGTAWCWGFNAEGQLGTGTLRRLDSFPVLVVSPVGFRTDPTIVPPSPDPDFPLPPGPFIAAGYSHTCALGLNGSTYCWGLNENGQLGDGTTTLRRTPTPVSTGLLMSRITAGQSHSCGITSDGTAYCWGDNTYGQLGDGTTSDRLTPTAVGGGLSFAYLKAGDLSTCGVTTSGVAYCWGDNEYGQLGNGGHTAALLPAKVAFQP